MSNLTAHSLIKGLPASLLALLTVACSTTSGPAQEDLATVQVRIEAKLTQTAQALPTATSTRTPAPTATSTTAATATSLPTPLGGGGQIAYASNKEGNFDIFVMDVGGDAVQRMTTSLFDDNEPAWSGDGGTLAYTSWYDDGTHVLLVISHEGGEPKLISRFPLVHGGSPTWSIDDRIAYWATKCTAFCDKGGYNRSVIYFVDEDGSNVEFIQPFLTTIPLDPSWSPDGKLLAILDGTEWSTDIEVITADGDRHQTIREFKIYRDPAFSPDGSMLAFSSDEQGDFDVYVFYLDGTYLSRLTQNSGDDRHPTWSPDGTQLAFSSDRGGNWDLYVINLDGSGEQALTSSEADEIEPSWGPGP